MEVYLQYMRQIGEQRMDCLGSNLFLCLSGGRKVAIAALICCTFQSVGQLPNRFLISCFMIQWDVGHYLV
jgi:hypothetical protein